MGTYIFLRFWAWLFRWDLIWLLDEDKLLLSKVKYSPWGKWCYKYWMGDTVDWNTKIMLKSDGICEKFAGFSTSIKKWAPYKGMFPKLDRFKKEKVEDKFDRYQIAKNNSEPGLCKFCKNLRGVK